MAFEVGAKVRVVKVDGEEDKAYVGRVGAVYSHNPDAEREKYEFAYGVDFGNDDLLRFHEDELAAVTVLEGVAYVFRDSEGNVTDVLVGGQSLHEVVENHKRYKVTIEEVA